MSKSSCTSYRLVRGRRNGLDGRSQHGDCVEPSPTRLDRQGNCLAYQHWLGLQTLSPKGRGLIGMHQFAEVSTPITTIMLRLRRSIVLQQSRCFVTISNRYALEYALPALLTVLPSNLMSVPLRFTVSALACMHGCRASYEGSS